jgi:hypothetical protein
MYGVNNNAALLNILNSIGNIVSFALRLNVIQGQHEAMERFTSPVPVPSYTASSF